VLPPYPPRRTRAHGAILGARSPVILHRVHGQPATLCAPLMAGRIGRLRPASLPPSEVPMNAPLRMFGPIPGIGEFRGAGFQAMP